MKSDSNSRWLPPAAWSRREFVQRAATLTAAAAFGGRAQAAAENRPLAREVGVTTGTFLSHYQKNTGDPRQTLLELPNVMHGELGMRVIDLMTATVPSFEPAFLDRFRAAVDRAGCVVTNLKMNQPGLDLAAEDEPTRRRAIDEYKRTMTSAARLGVRWVRPVSGRAKGPNYHRLVSSYRELIDHGGPLGITILIENVGWIKDDVDAIPDIIREVGTGLRAQPDTGNWTDAARYPGLTKAFPFAASCDFKALELETDGTHRPYDLRRCFQIGWAAGFRGPWCLEHFNADFDALLRDLRFLRDQLGRWMQASAGK
jgi:hypothetical protein